MLAVIAAIWFLLALLKVHMGDVDLVDLGLLFLALHFIYPWNPWPAHRGAAPPP